MLRRVAAPHDGQTPTLGYATSGGEAATDRWLVIPTAIWAVATLLNTTAVLAGAMQDLGTQILIRNDLRWHLLYYLAIGGTAAAILLLLYGPGSLGNRTRATRLVAPCSLAALLAVAETVLYRVQYYYQFDIRYAPAANERLIWVSILPNVWLAMLVLLAGRIANKRRPATLFAVWAWAMLGASITIAVLGARAGWEVVPPPMWDLTEVGLRAILFLPIVGLAMMLRLSQQRRRFDPFAIIAVGCLSLAAGALHARFKAATMDSSLINFTEQAFALVLWQIPPITLLLRMLWLRKLPSPAEV